MSEESNEIYAVAASVKTSKTMPGPVGNSHFPLNSAYLCQDCSAVGNNSTKCPACSSGVLMGLAAVLNRDEESDIGSYDQYYSGGSNNLVV